MFKLIAFLFLAANPSEPVSAMSYNQANFASEEACFDFFNTDAGKAATGQIQSMAAAKSIVVRFACVKQEDNTI